MRAASTTRDENELTRSSSWGRLPSTMPTARWGMMVALLAVLAVVSARCSARQHAGENLELRVPVSSYDFRQNPELLERIVASPYGYFRFINQRFAQSLCVRFAEDLTSMPKVNLHGDAHVGQYSVTESGRGLTDFDDASIGPAILDLIRFGVPSSSWRIRRGGPTRSRGSSKRSWGVIERLSMIQKPSRSRRVSSTVSGRTSVPTVGPSWRGRTR